MAKIRRIFPGDECRITTYFVYLISIDFTYLFYLWKYLGPISILIEKKTQMNCNITKSWV